MSTVCILAALCAGAPAQPDSAPGRYLALLERFAGWAEQHWNEKEQSYDAAGSGVTWARGNGDVCIVHAVLLTELRDRQAFSARKVPRDALLDHVRRTLRTLCLRNRNCADPRAVRPPAWGGPSWQSGLETEHWVVAAHLLGDRLDDETRALVRQVATAEAEASRKEIPSEKRGNTAADDCVWNAGMLGVAAAIYDDDPRAAAWDEWSRRWALNMEAREPDRKSTRVVDGKPLGEWLVSTNVHPDLTLENHGFWSVPYQVCFAALAEPAVAYRLRAKEVPGAYTLNGAEEGEGILKWLTLADGDLLAPHGQEWAERDVQHSWAYTWLGTVLDIEWARGAEERCLRLLEKRQAAFGDGALHANDFGYETDLACCWSYCALLHKLFPRAGGDASFHEPAGAKLFPHVAVGVFRTPGIVSSVAWFRSRQLVLVVPNDLRALGDLPSFTAYNASSGLGWIRLAGKKTPPFEVEGEARITQEGGALAVSFARRIPRVAAQEVGYYALPSGEVVVFSRWRALGDVEVAELVDHPFFWVVIPGFLPPRAARAIGKGTWSVDGKLRMQVIGGGEARVEKDALLGSVRAGPWSAKAGDVLQESACVYQAEAPGREPPAASGDARRVVVGGWTIERGEDGRLTVTPPKN